MEPPPPMIRCTVPKRNSPWNHVGRIFLTGLLTVLPVIATLYFVLWVLSVLEKFFGKQLLLLMPDEWYRTGMGLAMAVVIVFLVGLLMHAILFRRLFGWAEKVLLEIPLVRSVYAALRDLLGLFAQHKEPSLQVVALDLPGNLRVLGFITRSDFSDAPPGIARADELPDRRLHRLGAEERVQAGRDVARGSDEVHPDRRPQGRLAVGRCEAGR